ncbi:sensor histidine kinase [Marinobacterium rhizophilum]|uniref:histidine kinase n=1 Tax=Marinobacterium rhizophilum TaxID=420402 RepID=A0ABY5HLN2_9GAMM|nr:ATP-binding protein [Marinobacterium rhizophilum]UTW13193.1 PAS domain S-box protein [Marinobacterium rhizophilum]
MQRAFSKRTRRRWGFWLAGLGLAVALALLAADRARDWTLQYLQRTGTQVLLSRIGEIRSWLDSYDYLPFLLTQNRDVRALLLYPNQDMGVRVSRYLEQTSLVAGSSGLFILDGNGRAVAYSRWRDQQDFYLRSHRDRNYFTDAREGQQGRRFRIDSDQLQPAFYLSAPIYDERRFIGAAVVRLSLALLQERLDPGVPWMLTSSDGRVFAASQSGWLQQPFAELAKESRDIRLDNGTRVSLWPSRTGGETMVQSVQLDDLGWTLSIQQDAGAARRNQRSAMLLTLGGCIAFALLLLFLRERALKQRLQRQAQQALANSEQQQRDIIDTAQVGLITVDEQGRMRFLNGTALQQFGLSASLALAQPLRRLLAPSAGFGVLERALGRLGQRGFAPLIGQEAVGLRGDGSEFPLLISIRAMKGAHAGQARYLVTVIDISRRKRLERALQDANETLEAKVEDRTRELQGMQQELLQAEKLAALGRMASAVVHELNQPLTAMRTYVAICRKMLQQPQLLSESLDEVDGLVGRMAVITSQLKTFAYRKPERVEAVSLLHAIDQALALFRGRFVEEQVQVDFKPDIADDRVAGDSARLEQVLVNLIKNGCDAMQHTEAPRRLSLQLLAEDGWFELRLADQGTGIDEGALDKLFEPFFTTKQIGSGLGLGLSIVRSIVRDLGGNIRAENTPEGGACFILRLPRYEQVKKAERGEGKADS